ncbi:MAG: double zinc ribbon domain-containing protein [bacterium]|nr:double zinc ribbon domain-containing protein [bacterium]
MALNFFKIKQNAEKIQSFFLDLIFPIECLGCGRDGEWLCPECVRAVKLKSGQYCLHCKQENDYGGFCAACGIIYSLNGVWIAALYDDLLISRAIKSLKYYFISGAAAGLSRIMILFIDNLLGQAKIIKYGLADGLERRRFEQAKNLPAAILNFNENLIMPVPLSKKRRRWRGFNQAELLAGALAKNYGLALDCKNLIRIKHKKPQAKLNEIQRLANIKDCFAWQGGNLNNKNIVLVDDVVTTGATLNECAKVLKAAGAGEVWALVAAKG